LAAILHHRGQGRSYRCFDEHIELHQGETMEWLGLLLGLGFGRLAGDGWGALAGGIMGFLLGLLANGLETQRKRVTLLEKEVARLAAELKTSRESAPPLRDAFPENAAVSAIAPQLQEVPPAVGIAEAEVPPAPQPAAAAAPGREPLWSRLFQGNILARAGAVLLFFGIASALKLAVAQGWLPPQARAALAFLAGAAMIGFGYRQARAALPSRRMFGLALQGGGFALMYLAIYYLFARIPLIPPSLAFLLFAAVGGACVLLALRQNGSLLALLGISGAFLSPLLTGNGSEGPLLLFSYFLVLNLFILAVNQARGWVALNVAGFLFTFVIGMQWGMDAYLPDYLAQCEAFLLLFFLLYTLVPAYSAARRPASLDGKAPALLLFAVPLAAALLQAALLREVHYGAATSAFAAALYYLGLGIGLRRQPADVPEWFSAGHFVIAAGFLTTAFPLAFGAQLTAATWALEGAALVWLGVHSGRPLVLVAGAALQGIAAWYLSAVYLLAYLTGGRQMPIFNDVFLATLTLSVAGMLSAWFLQRQHAQANSRAATLWFFAWGLLWWFVAGLSDIHYFASEETRLAWILMFALGSSLLLEILGTRQAWLLAARPAGLLLLFLMWAAWRQYRQEGHVLAESMALAFPLALAACYGLLRRHKAPENSEETLILHAAAYWLAALTLANEAAWQLAYSGAGWNELAWAGVLAGSIHLIQGGLARGWWPFVVTGRYLTVIAAPLAIWLAFWVLRAVVLPGVSWPVHVPLLNPMDLLQGFALLTLLRWCLAVPGISRRLIEAAGFVLALVWLSAVAARAVHAWWGIPYNFWALNHSVLMQATLSMIWTGGGLALLLYASRQGLRRAWFAGFGLVALVGVKLLLVDMSNAGSIAWSATLIGVALLVIAAGYFSPVPPKKTEE